MTRKSKELILDFEDEELPYEWERFKDTFVTLAACNKKKIIVSSAKEIKYTQKYKLKMRLLSNTKVEFSLIEKDKAVVDVTLEEGDCV